MPGLIAPNIVRYTINGTYGGRDVANVLDFRLIPTTPPTSRADAIAAHAEVLVTAWASTILTRICDDYVAQDVSWVDLNSEDGTVGSTSTGTGTDFPAAGAVTDTPMPGNVALRALKQITAVRGQRKGRLYLVGIPESTTVGGAPNTVDPTIIDDWNVVLDDFLDDVNVAVGVGEAEYNALLAVVHTHLDTDVTPNVLEYSGYSLVNALLVDNRLRTQRRRLGR